MKASMRDLLLVGVLLCGACGDDATAAEDSAGPGDPPAAGSGASGDPAADPDPVDEPRGDTPTWHGRVGPIVGARCGGCHAAGGVAPFPLESPDDVADFAGLVASAVEERRMPPMPPDDRDCRPLSDVRIMPDDERVDLLRYLDEGMPLGEPGAAVPELPSFVDEPALGPPTSRVGPSTRYTSEASGLDDYRCVIVDPGWDGPRHLRALGVVPENTAIVHHVIVYVQLPQNRDAVDALDEADPGPGYTCFGGAGFTGAFALGGYAPGAPTRAFAGGASVTLPAGTRFVMQMHYNFLSGDGDDATELSLWELDAPSGVTPSSLMLINRGFRIPAGDADYSVTGTSSVVADASGAAGTALGRLQTEPAMAWGVGAHMHTRGKALRIDLVRADGDEECLLDIPRWDFDWQGQYRFREPLALGVGDEVRITCHWDNSADNQPVVDGEPLVPQAITWGEGTLDEMCLGGVQLTPLP